MINRFIRNTVNLLIYGGTFIGLCAACMTALSFELTGRADKNLRYILFIGAATAALYCSHKVIGLNKLAHIQNSERYAVIRKYKSHIWLYFGIWMLLTLWLFIPIASIKLMIWLVPGGVIAGSYVLPFLTGGKRLRDLGWGKIIMIGWSWSWLTAFIPLYYFADAPLQMAIAHGLERLLFIIAITIPFEIRDLMIDQSVGLITIPEIIGKEITILLTRTLCFIIVALSLIVSFHYFNPAYALAMTLTCIPIVSMVRFSYKTEDDYFFSGLTDGLMIFALVMFSIAHFFF